VNRFVDWAIGGWETSLDAVMYSGFPITIGSSNASASNNGGGARANQYRKLVVTGRSVANWFGTDPSATPCTGPNVVAGVVLPCAYGAELANSFGTAHVGTERAPGYRVVDTSLFKQFRTFREQFVQLRIDAFNVGNIASYAAPGSTASTPSTFGLITSTLSPARQLQYSLKYGF
jgi:hypothetical protein